MRGGQGHETCLQVEPFVVGDDNQLCFSHAGNIMNPVPFSLLGCLTPISLPLLFLRIIN